MKLLSSFHRISQSLSGGRKALALLAVSIVALAGEASAEQCLKLDYACEPRPPAACQAGTESGAPKNEPEACAAARDRWLSCMDQLVKRCGPGLDHASAKGKKILGTVWDGKGLRDGRYIFRFKEDGVLDYTTPTGDWTSGRWIHANGQVIVSMNEGFAIYVGKIEKDILSGFADNTRAETWGWRLKRQ